MKITIEDQNKLEELLIKNIPKWGNIDGVLQSDFTVKNYMLNFRKAVKDGNIKIRKCEATNCFARLLHGEALAYLCDVIYKYANDSHLQTFYKKMYKKH